MRYSVFPFTPEIEVLSRHLELLSDNDISNVISFKEDIQQLKSFENRTHIPCTSSVDEGIEQADALVLLDNQQGFTWDKYYDCIDAAISCSKPIYAGRMLIDNIPDTDRKIHIKRLENIHTLHNRYVDRRLFEIETPIIVILGMGENCGKFECQLEFKSLLDSQGHRAEHLSSNPLSALMGMKSLPDFLFDQDLSFPEKVLELNKYVFDLCSLERPDVLVIEMPSGIMPFTEKDTNYFGEIPLVMSSALPIDYGIETFYYRIDNTNSFLQQISQYALHRYQIRVPVFYMSRQMMVREQEGHKIGQLFLSDKYIAQHPSALSLMDNVAAPLKNNTPVFQALISSMQENVNIV